MRDDAEKRGQLIRHLEDALALADEIEDGQTADKAPVPQAPVAASTDGRKAPPRVRKPSPHNDQCCGSICSGQKRTQCGSATWQRNYRPSSGSYDWQRSPN